MKLNHAASRGDTTAHIHNNNKNVVRSWINNKPSNKPNIRTTTTKKTKKPTPSDNYVYIEKYTFEWDGLHQNNNKKWYTGRIYIWSGIGFDQVYKMNEQKNK